MPLGARGVGSPSARSGLRMNEQRAREVTLLEAFETAQPAAPSWSDEDRAWANRVALEAAGADAPADEFVAQRARHAMQRLASRERLAARWLAGPSSRGRWGVAIVVLAFGFGLVADRIGSGQRINLLAPPLWGVIVWNAVVYAVLVGSLIAGALRHRTGPPGPIVKGVQWLMRTGGRLPRLSAGGSASAWQRFGLLWIARARVLSMLRAEAVLHAGAAALALGMIAGLYARGLVLDYRVAWESTFLGPGTAHALVSTLLGPASMLSGIALPDAAGFATLQAAHDERIVGAPAAPWIHLIALSLALFVVLPRALLALGCAARAAWRSRRFALPLDEPYFQRLLRLQRGGAAHVCVWPYAHTPSPQATLALRAVFAEAFGARVAVQVAPTVAFGTEDEAALTPAPATTHAVALFDLSATPEAENHGRLVERLRRVLPSGAALAVLVDEAAFRRRFAGLAERLAQRRQAWRDFGAALGAVPVFVDLDATVPPASIEGELQAAFATVPVAAPR